jgi:hypothetical protein
MPTEEISEVTGLSEVVGLSEEEISALSDSPVH